MLVKEMPPSVIGAPSKYKAKIMEYIEKNEPIPVSDIREKRGVVQWLYKHGYRPISRNMLIGYEKKDS